MSDEDEEQSKEGPRDWNEWFEEALGTIVAVAVIGASLIVPLAFWVAAKFFGWEPPEFLQEWIDYFSA
ncbi:MAG: hypothetical protein QM775_10900 [Pirellulales bacterium]